MDPTIFFMLFGRKRMGDQMVGYSARLSWGGRGGEGTPVEAMTKNIIYVKRGHQSITGLQGIKENLVVEEYTVGAKLAPELIGAKVAKRCRVCTLKILFFYAKCL
jgi:hypothetical protein